MGDQRGHVAPSVISIFFQSILVLVNGTVIDGTGAPARANAVVEIRGDRIVRVSTTGDYRIPDGADVVDMSCVERGSRTLHGTS